MLYRKVFLLIFCGKLIDVKVFFAFVFVYLKKNVFFENFVVRGNTDLLFDTLCYLMASHCNPMISNLRIPSFVETILRVRRCGLCTMLPSNLGTYKQ